MSESYQDNDHSDSTLEIEWQTSPRIPESVGTSILDLMAGFYLDYVKNQISRQIGGELIGEMGAIVGADELFFAEAIKQFISDNISLESIDFSNIPTEFYNALIVSCTLFVGRWLMEHKQVTASEKFQKFLDEEYGKLEG